MKLKEHAIERVNNLIEKGKWALSQKKMLRGIPYMEKGPFTGWATQTLTFLGDVTGRNSDYYIEFSKCTEKVAESYAESGIRILESLREDIGQGYIEKLEATISANVFGDFLEMADYFLSEKYKDAAASICGAALETGLRKILNLKGLSPKESDRLQALNEKCLKAEVYNKIRYGDVKVWKDIRDHAAHGEYNEYDAQQVRNMIDGTRGLLGEHLEAYSN
ncbi:hypothetical protein KKC97_06955 [bacterium]|nr:hypothetical protein [bacterium]MBU1637388.1 hypothetical protein [bacterium]